MILRTVDGKRMVDIGSYGIWYSVYSTADVRLSPMKKNISLAMSFLKDGKCSCKDAYETARQINLIRDAFSQISPENAVYNKDDPNELAPWTDNLSGIVTSCGNLYTTADGKDLLYELVCILTFAHYKKVDVTISE